MAGGHHLWWAVTLQENVLLSMRFFFWLRPYANELTRTPMHPHLSHTHLCMGGAEACLNLHHII